MQLWFALLINVITIGYVFNNVTIVANTRIFLKNTLNYSNDFLVFDQILGKHRDGTASI